VTRGPKYDQAFRRRRAELAPLVDAGLALCHEIVCLMPSRALVPGQPWDLAHIGDELLPAHQKCNRSEGSLRNGIGNRRPRTAWRSARRW